MKNILLVGDSFAADWSVKYQGCRGWPNILADRYHVINLAQAGVSEYKIWRQIQQAHRYKSDHVIISHTSPFRIPIERHPIHATDGLHSACDLMYEDIKSHAAHGLFGLVEYFEKWFDIDYAKFVHQLIIDREIVDLKMLGQHSVVHLKHIDINITTADQPCLDFQKIFIQHKGLINHFTDAGNRMVAQTLIEWIDQ